MNDDLTLAVKAVAKEAGADLVGIGSMDRFEGAPPEWDPRFIFPEARAIIGLAFRIPRGYYRGVEEGTHFYTYPTLGYSNINEVCAPITLRKVACFLEDNGYEGLALRNHGNTGPADCVNCADEGGQTLISTRAEHIRAVRPDQPAPDVTLHFRIAAFICGLGEIGFGKIFLTPEFGSRQRLAFVLTDAPLQADPLYAGPPICDRCKLCVKDCPGALSDTRTIKVTVAGRELEWAELDPQYCYFAYASGLSELNPFLPEGAYDDIPDGDKIMHGEKRPTPEEINHILYDILPKYYPFSPGGTPPGYFPAMCNGRGCMRACFIHLEQQGRLTNKFHDKFRKRRPWWRKGSA